MILIVGLGNVGNAYNNTYHNIGFDFIDALCCKENIKLNKTSKTSVYAKEKLWNQTAIIAKPTTYMNNSGECVLEFASKFKILPENVFVICDDIDMSLGKIRMKNNSSAGTHNGLRSICSAVGNGFYRIKIGVGRDSKFENLADFVLSKIPNQNRVVLNESVIEGIKLLQNQIEKIK